MSDEEVVSEVYVNPLMWELVGSLVNSPSFPTEDTVLGMYNSVRSVPSEVIIKLIMSDPRVSEFTDLIHSASAGMDVRGMAHVVATVLDKYFPNLVEVINTSESDFTLYKELITGLADKFMIQET